MKAFQSDRHRGDLIESLGTSALTSPARISEATKTLLVVDDDPMARRLETGVLRLQGYTVVQAKSAAEALRLAAKISRIDLLVTDVSMPEVDGLELTRRFRAVHPKTPVLMLSGSLSLLRASSEEGLDHFDFSPKPIQFDELLHKVHTLLDSDAPVPIRRRWCAD